MVFEEIQKILYGPWRPWIPGEQAAVLKRAAGPAPARQRPPVNMLCTFNKVQPINRLTLAYSRLIDEALDQELQRCIQSVNELEAPVDRTYRLRSGIRELEDLIKSADKLWQTQEQNLVTDFVLRRIVRGVMNIRMDLELRYREAADGKPLDVEQLYLRLLDRPLPEPDLITKTEEWYKREFKCQLQEAGRRELGSDDIISAVVDMLKEMASETAPVPKLVSAHITDALFLLKNGASFLPDYPERLAEASFCAEWIGGMKTQFVQCGEGGNLLSTLPGIYSDLIWLRQTLLSVLEAGRMPAGSEAAQWLLEIDRLPVAAGTKSPDNSNEVRAGSSFTEMFHSSYIHKLDLERTLDIDPKTLKGYLEDSGVRVLQLKSNIWYYRPDIERFFEDKTHKI